MFEMNLTKLGEELLMRGYDKSVVNLAFTRVRQLDRQSTLQKVVKPDDERITLVIPFDKRFGNVSQTLRHRWSCLMSRDPSAQTYMPLPPRVSYTRTSSLRDILVTKKRCPLSHPGAREQLHWGLRSVTREWIAVSVLIQPTVPVTLATLLERSSPSPPACHASHLGWCTLSAVTRGQASVHRRRVLSTLAAVRDLSRRGLVST